MMRRYHFYMITLVAIGLLFSIATMTVNGQGEHNIAMEREYYEELEKEYIFRVKELLADKGYGNAGITMTKVYEPDGKREYTVQIHHKRIDRLEQEEKALLHDELGAIGFGDDACHVLHKFLSYNG